ncbi:MAG: PQQ-dependent dehydrogenase, methanol/ethanol family [Nevskiaceae bacterium]|nr:MAG: PQQ-dependent dehydrogenase, methanol/ethanol family [Nevskiaceae bacterium]TBR75297.1 MAG: PQQ-dependent dehydrogenase, methanol/ethanol family [Nevskiaceae bacterium]
MKRNDKVALVAVVLSLIVTACGRGPEANAPPKANTAATNVAQAPSAENKAQPAKAAAGVDSAAIEANVESGTNWPTYGASYASTHYSALRQIDTKNVAKLGLAWTFDLHSTRHGVEAIPVVVDGVMYVSSPWNVVYALDATTGRQLWSYDPKTPRTIAYKGCCDVANRGVAVYQGRVYEATYDGRLIALDAATGKLVWSVDTLPDGNHNYTITAAPLAANGKIVIGNGGAEFFGVRGYVSAYDAATGKLDWRWYTVPGDPAQPYENDAMKAAAKTWDPKTKYWTKGGGGTVWQSFSYDPKLDLVYFGTGNADPWNQDVRGGPKYDSLYTASVVALNLSTGQYAWHYQTTPADPSDFDADQDMALAALKVDGQDVPVIMNANKNGFFFVLDRRNGKFISAKNFVPVNWAKGYDAQGKPILTDLVQRGKAFESVPGPFAAHNWQAASYSPDTGLAYIPAQHIPATLAPVETASDVAERVGGFMSGNGWNLGLELNAVPPKTAPFGRLIAWNPVTQTQAWAHDYPAPWNGGTLATAGNLVFQATADGRLVAFDAKDGTQLWETSLGQGAVAAPATYSVDGKQYVTIAVGWGGVAGQSFRATDREGPGTVFTFVLGGTASAPDFAKYEPAPLLSGVKYDPQDVPAGTRLYVNHCAVCHGVPGLNEGGSVPNLGHVGTGVIDNLDRFVFNGPFVSNGMPDFTGRLTPDDVTKIKAFIQATADAMRAKAADAGASKGG